MAQIEPIDAYLGPARTGLSIGATLYQLDGTTVHAAFATTGWYEAPAASGAWHHAGLSLPDAGGVVAVGVSGTEYMRVAVGAARPLASDYTATRAAKLDNLDAAVTTRATPAQVNTEADQALADVGLTTTITGRIDTTITSRGTSTLTTTDIDNRLTAYDAPTKAELDSSVAPLATQASVNALTSYVDTEVSAIKAKTDNLPTSPAATSDIPSASTIATAVWSNTTRSLTTFGTLISDVWSYVTRTLSSANGNIAIISSVSGNTISVYSNDTWSFTITNALLDLSQYEKLAFIAKNTNKDSDDESILYVRNDLGLLVVNGEPRNGNGGSLAINGNASFSVTVDMPYTNVDSGNYIWWLKGFDTTPITDVGYTLAKGVFAIKDGGIKAIS